MTTTSATPAACAGVVALICVALTTLTPVAALPPTATVAVASKFVPVMVMAVPPAVGPEVGVTAVTVGGEATKVNWSAGFAALDCPLTVTTTSAMPAAWTGVVALICAALTTGSPVAPVPPTATVAAPVSKFVPVIEIDVPPAVGPEVGLTPLTVGGGGARYVNWSPGLVALDCPPTVTTTSAMPAAWAGVVALICDALTTLTPIAAAPPMVTVAVASKPVPVMVMGVRPADRRGGGATPLTV